MESVSENSNPCEDEGRNWGDVPTSQVMPKISGNYQKLEKMHRTVSPSECPEGTNHANTLILDFWLPEL